MAKEYPPLKIVPGFSWLGINLGIKDKTPDFGVIASDCKCSAAGVFTKNNIPGAPIIIGREHIQDGQLQAIVVNSKIANVATGQSGIEDAKNMCRWTASSLGIDAEQVLPSSTGVIGVRLPVEKIQSGCKSIPKKLGSTKEHIENFARAIMTTDTKPKWSCESIGNATLLGVAKGAGMIEPEMATMLGYFVTDASLNHEFLQKMLVRVVNKSFNRISIDTDTSTSDTVIVMANGHAGEVDTEKFEEAFTRTAVNLAKEIASDGEGSKKLIELTVSGAESQQMALQIAKSVVNSPLIKTAISGADPNWGRFVMAVGKVFQYPVNLDELSIQFGCENQDMTINVHKMDSSKVNLDAISKYLQKNELQLKITVGKGLFAETVWGCDLTKEYIEINSFYTT